MTDIRKENKLKLSAYAKQFNVAYKTALSWVKDGRINATRLATGTIIIPDDAGPPKEKGTYISTAISNESVAPAPEAEHVVKTEEAAYTDAMNVVIDELRGLRADIKAYMTDTGVAAEQVAEPVETPSSPGAPDVEVTVPAPAQERYVRRGHRKVKRS